MMTSTEEQLAARVRSLYAEAAPLLDAKARLAVEQYLDHDEFEMAFEGLCIELLKSHALTRRRAAPYLQLALALGLDTEASFDDRIVFKLRSIQK